MLCIALFSFFSDSAPTEIYTLSLHDALPILSSRANRGALARRRPPSQPARVASERGAAFAPQLRALPREPVRGGVVARDRKSTRLNSSHRCISYAVFCLKKKKSNDRTQHHG